MLKDVEFLARKQEQIANRALQLQHENQVMQQQIMLHLQNAEQKNQQNQTLLQENRQLKTQLEQIKQNLKLLYLAVEQPTHVDEVTKSNEKHSQVWLPNPEFEEKLTQEVEEKLKQVLQLNKETPPQMSAPAVVHSMYNHTVAEAENQPRDLQSHTRHASQIPTEEPLQTVQMVQIIHTQSISQEIEKAAEQNAAQV
jgi:hypothetical protein